VVRVFARLVQGYAIWDHEIKRKFWILILIEHRSFTNHRNLNQLNKLFPSAQM